MTTAFVDDSRQARAAAAAPQQRRRLWAAWLLVGCVGCASPPAVHLHTLMPAERPQPRDGVAVAAGPAVLVEAVKVPAEVDQPQWLIRMPDGTLALLESERWAAPLADELRQALREILSQRYGAVEAPPGDPATPSWRLRVEVTRFESSPGEARLESTWTLTQRTSKAPALRCTTYLQESAGGGMAALAEAHRRAVARLGDLIGEQLVGLQKGEPGRCPS